jgi:archaemetzincin
VRPEIQILNRSALRDRDLQTAASTTGEIFGVSVSIMRLELDLRQAFDQSRNQTNSTALLAQVLSGSNDDTTKRIAVVDVDLFIPVLTFVFGEAQLGGTAAILSTHRLDNRFYGLPRDPALMIRRLEKEIVHELGHNFGLYHCHQFECVMRSSTYVEEIDMKRVQPCPACAEAIAGHHQQKELIKPQRREARG